MNKFKKFIIFSLIITLPLSLFYSIWLLDIYNQNKVMDKIKLHMTKGHRLYQLGIHNYNSLYNGVLSSLGYKNQIDVNILISNNIKNKFFKNIPPKNLDYKKIALIYNGEFLPLKIKLRGDNFWHWLYNEKSWRIKTKKTNLIHSNRKINFIVPKGNEAISNHILSFKLAKELNLLAPEATIKSFYINGKFNDYRMMIEQIDENFLRKNKMMPNDVYKGDMEGQNFIFGVKINLFSNSSIWTKSCVNNHYPKNSKKPLEKFLTNIKDNNYSLYNDNTMASFLTFIDLTASYHYDFTHNWLLLYDNYYEKFYPIIWDPNPWRIAWLQDKTLNIISAKPLESLYKNYNILKEKYNVLYSFNKFKKDKFLALAKQEIKKEININKNTFFKRTSVNNQLLNSLYDNIKKRFDLTLNNFIGKVNQQDYSYSILKDGLRLSINNYKMINTVILKIKPHKNLKSLSIKYILNGVEKKHNIKFTQNNNVITIDLQLLANTKIIPVKNTPWKKLIYTEATYDLEFEGLNVNDIEDVKYQFLNMDNQILRVRKIPHIEQKNFHNVHNVVQEYKDTTPIVWQGIKYVKGFNIINQDIIIKPGTKIIFDENTTLKVLGKVTAIGTKQNPITFKAKDKTKHWNTFALKDAKANGSVFKHCIFRDGSGDKGALYEYTAMLSIHNVKDFLVQDCEFYDSHRTDDMVHVIYSKGKFKNTKFIRSLSDALDVDISNIEVDNCEFIDSGNDAIDLMTTNAVVTNTKFYNSADKGISIGEGSNLLAINNYIKGSEIGMQSKDTSKAYIYNTSFIANKKAVDAYHKNLRYSEGGTIMLEHCIFDKNILNATVGKKSKVIINNSDIDTPNKFDKKSLEKQKIIISSDNFIECDFKEPLFKDKNSLISKERRGYHE